MIDSVSNVPSPNVQITFPDDIPQSHRQAVEDSIALVAKRRVEEITRLRDTEADEAKLIDILNAPFKRLIEEDPAAAKALDELRSQKLIDLGTASPANEMSVNEMSTLITTPYTLSFTALSSPVEIHVPPHYHYSWNWVWPPGSPSSAAGATVGIASITGFIGVTAKSGHTPGGASGFITSHAGYGLSLTTDRPVRAVGRSFKKLDQYNYEMKSYGFGTNATTEGGIEFTAFEDDRLLGDPSHTVWRKRISQFDGDVPGGECCYAIYDPTELAFDMNPGHIYHFNVGAWVNADTTQGAGVAACGAALKVDVLAINIFR